MPKTYQQCGPGIPVLWVGWCILVPLLFVIVSHINSTPQYGAVRGRRTGSNHSGMDIPHQHRTQPCLVASHSLLFSCVAPGKRYSSSSGGCAFGVPTSRPSVFRTFRDTRPRGKQIGFATRTKKQKSAWNYFVSWSVVKDNKTTLDWLACHRVVWHWFVMISSEEKATF